MDEEILNLAQACRYEKQHSHQVADIALKLFDQLKPSHSLTGDDRNLLECAGILHDIGWIKGRAQHHKTGRDIILDSEIPFPPAEKTILALVVRYHRKTLPQETHKYYGDLDPAAKKKVCILAGLLRLADGLDRSHRSLVRNLSCKVSPSEVKVTLVTEVPVSEELIYGGKKADLLEQCLKRKIILECGLISK